ncbi:unnamed protein product [Cuscuta campestris]|uniref:Uncharacterized protein n=1 Tax=Cuscuta campestris TaxID=132261 RepID=A0A484KR12_9ASTE|nr:unnamed protein product [Cuscuta campestris]
MPRWFEEEEFFYLQKQLGICRRFRSLCHAFFKEGCCCVCMVFAILIKSVHTVNKNPCKIQPNKDDLGYEGSGETSPIAMR